MLLVTFHGGHPGKQPLNNNIHAYDKDGNEVTPGILQDSDGLVLDELRGISRVGKLLYVIVANKNESALLCYKGSDTNYKLVGKFASQETCEAIAHPFDFVFDDDGHCYVSSQDTNVVTRLKVSPDGKTGVPARIAQALPQQGNFLAGTFVASSVPNLNNLATSAVAAPAGLAYSAVGVQKHSVRGLAWVHHALYVADEPAGRVKVYDKDGKFLGQSNQIKEPVHLVVHEHTLYVSSGDAIFTSKLTKPPGNFVLSPVPGINIKKCGAMAVTEAGHIYVASRTENFIRKFDANFHEMPFTCSLPDNPEFMLHVKGEGATVGANA